jgi:hypothetical protein
MVYGKLPCKRNPTKNERGELGREKLPKEGLKGEYLEGDKASESTLPPALGSNSEQADNRGTAFRVGSNR